MSGVCCGRWWLLTAALVIGLGACGVRMNPGLETPEQLAEVFMGQISLGDYDGAYDLASSQVREAIALEQWTECWDAALRDVEQFRFVAVRSVPSEREENLHYLQGYQEWTRNGEVSRNLATIYATRSGSDWLYWQIETGPSPEERSVCFDDLTMRGIVPTPEFVAEADAGASPDG